jgi:ABC-type nickel/cobalt efflux system permease component RcnA
MWPLFILIALLLGIVLAFTSLLAAVFGGLGSTWPVLLILAGAWMLWRADGRGREHRRHGRRYEKRAERHAAKQAEERTKAAEPKPVPLRPRELPIDVQVKVEQIRRKVEVLLSLADRFPPFSQDLYLVRQTATDYLPRTIDAYLALPKHVAERPLSAEGKTPHQELKSQLDLLDAKLDEIAQDMQRQDMDRLLANRRFLEERFGKVSA